MSSFFTRRNVYIINFVLAFGLLLSLVNSLKSNENGINAQASAGCAGSSCHAGSANPATTVSISSGSGFSVQALGSLNITVRVAHASLVAGGFDAFVSDASSGGNTKGTFSNVGSGVKIKATTDVTHTLPKNFTGGGCDFTFTWTAPATPGTYYLQVTGNAVNLDGNVIGDVWNTNTQAITVTAGGSVTVLTPNGGENVCQGASTPITWTSSGITNVKIELSTDGGSTYPTVLTASTPASSGNFPWPIAANQTANNLNKIRISDELNAGIFDVSNANFTVNPITAISTQPIATTACVGNSTSLVVSAVGTGLSYLWKKDGINVTNGTSSTLTIPSAVLGDGGNYLCVVSGSCGVPVNSQSVLLTVKSPPAITEQPQPKTVCIGSNGYISANASGDGLTFKWQKNGSDILDATSRTLTIANFQPSSVGSYRFLATSSNCNQTVTSEAVAVTAGIAPSITSQPKNLVACENTTATLYVDALGTNLTYQWYQNGTMVNGYTSATISFPNALVARSGLYYCLIKGSCDPAISSATINLNINTAPKMLINPLSKTIAEGGSVTFTTSASNTISAIQYEWYKGANALAGQTASTLVLNNLTIADAGDYNCKLTNNCGSTNSAVATLNVSSSGNGILTLANDVINFGDVLQNSPVDKNLTDFLTNDGKKALKITAVNIKGTNKDNFVIKGFTLPLTLDVKKSQSIVITYSPGTRGINTATADFVTEDGQTIPLSLLGNASISKSLITLNNTNFTVKAKVNETVSTTLTLTNPSNFPETISSVDFSDINFYVNSTSNTFTIDANKSKDLVVLFNPKVTGNYSCTATIKVDYVVNPLKAYFTSTVGGNSVEYDETLIDNFTAIPNPINGYSEISFAIPMAQTFEFSIVDAQGKLVKMFKEQVPVSGNYIIKWDGTDSNSNPLNSGIYYGVYNSNNKIKTIILNIKR
jgi:hypothetical protein